MKADEGVGFIHAEGIFKLQEEEKEMTEKQYYINGYSKVFTATVTDCRQAGDQYGITLDTTLFYPEGGGQPSDRGIINQLPVLDVQEQAGEIIHFIQEPISRGTAIQGEIDWNRRFLLMQQHTGEHIVSGIIHEKFGYDNVGFHMGKDAVTIDFNGLLSEKELDQVEQIANEAVWGNISLEIYDVSQEILRSLAYRSKKELAGQVRIVEIPGVDRCACCGTHVQATGEIGIIKLLSAKRYKGGTRIAMLCGTRAFQDYRQKHKAITGITNLLSAKPQDGEEAVNRLYEETKRLKQHIGDIRQRLFYYRAMETPENTPVAVLFEEGLSTLELRKFCQAVCERAELAAVFSPGEKGQYKYALGSNTLDVREYNERLCHTFSGRGGGPKELCQGTILAGKTELELFFQHQ